MPASTSLCVDCQDNDSTLTIRKRRLCALCFQKYVASKILKRMETYRFRNQVGETRRRLLLPVSGSASPLALLEVLDKQIQKQLKQQGRTAYEIVVCHVDLDLNSADGAPELAWYSQLHTRFDLHTYVPVVKLTEVCRLDTHLEQDFTPLGITRLSEVNESDSDFVKRLLSSAKTVTARADIAQLLLKRLIISIAKQNACTSVIWGYSDSKLAAKALAEVAKGRGGAVSSDLSDGPSAWGLDFNYPLRDLYTSELELYLQTLPDDIRPCWNYKQDTEEQEVPVSLKMTSIDALLENYITSQGSKYPSIMANVVRTASKLQVPNLADGRGCGLCSMPVAGDASEPRLCYGCQRTKQDFKA